MTITREELESGTIDFSDVDAPGSPRMPPVHPGDSLQQWIDEDGLTAEEIAEGTKVPPDLIRGILAGERPVSAALAMRLSRYLGTTARFWLNLQVAYDLEVAERAEGEIIAREVTPRAARLSTGSPMSAPCGPTAGPRRALGREPAPRFGNGAVMEPGRTRGHRT